MSATEMTSYYVCHEPGCGATFPTRHGRASHLGYCHPLPPDATDKVCSSCEERKPLSAFTADANRIGGYRSECRACNNVRQNSRRKQQQEPRSRTVPRVLESPLAEWKDEAPCRGLDPALFYPEVGTSPAAAIEVCRECPFREPCLDQALANHEMGVWGATTEGERRRMRRSRRWAT